MATYSSIKGAAVQTLASNSNNEGQIWYDSASDPFKLQKSYGTGAWISGGAYQQQFMVMQELELQQQVFQ
jgi:hypothetical protein